VVDVDEGNNEGVCVGYGKNHNNIAYIVSSNILFLSRYTIYFSVTTIAIH
jgi:hypothetical protein